MKPDWDKLMDAYKSSATQLVGDVDCTAAGQPLCDANGVQGYPTIKWGDPNALKDYEGDREYEALVKFVDENLKPMCSPANIDLCDPTESAEIETFSALADAELATKIAAEEKKIEDAETEFKNAVEQLQVTYNGLVAAKEKAAADVKASGLGLMKSVQAHKAKISGDKEEL